MTATAKQLAYWARRVVPRDGNCRRCGEFIPEEERTYNSDPRRSHIPPQIRPCRECERKAKRSQRVGLDRTAARRRDAKIRARKNGNVYVPKAERLKRAAERRVAKIRDRVARPKRTAGADLVERLRIEMPELYDASLKKNALVYRARYYLDAEFRAKQIKRTHERKTLHGLFDDGTLTPDVICRLFGDASECPYCGKWMQSRDKQLDHVFPRAHGGEHSIHNVLVCCKHCNARKRDKLPAKWIATLKPEFRRCVEAFVMALQGQRAGAA